MTLEPEIELRPVGFSIACELMSIDLFTEFLESTAVMLSRRLKSKKQGGFFRASTYHLF